MSDFKNIIIFSLISVIVFLGFDFINGKRSQNEGGKKLIEDVSRNNLEEERKEYITLDLEEAIKLQPRAKLKNEKLSGSINLVGGIIDDFSLLEYSENVQSPGENRGNKEKKFIRLLAPEQTSLQFFLKINYVANGTHDFPNEKTVWKIIPENSEHHFEKNDRLNLSENQTKKNLKSKNVIKVFCECKDLIFEREYGLDENYMLTIHEKIFNKSNNSISIARSIEMIRGKNTFPKTPSSVHEGLISETDDGIKEVPFSKFQKTLPVSYKISDGWSGFTDKYWFVSFIKNKDKDKEAEVNVSSNDLFSKIKINKTGLTLKAKETFEYEEKIFIGAKVLKTLDEYRTSLGIKNFDLVVDFGWLYFITKPLLACLSFFNSILGGMVWAIIVITLIMKILTIPMTNKSQKSMQKLKDVQPKIDQLKKLYGSDKIKFNEELIKLYKKENVKPMGGFLPILLQLPIFFCLYKVLSISIEMRHAPLFLWIKDLSSSDPLTVFNLMGLINWTPPKMLQVGILPILMSLTMVLQQKMGPQSNDPVQNKMMYVLPIVFLFLFSSMPSGLVFYFVLSNILGILHQFIMSKKNGGGRIISF